MGKQREALRETMSKYEEKGKDEERRQGVLKQQRWFTEHGLEKTVGGDRKMVEKLDRRHEEMTETEKIIMK